MSSKDVVAPQELINALNGWKRFVCVGHVTPDADCLGALLALARAWSADGNHQVTVALPPGSLSLRLRFMVDLAGVDIATPEHFRAAHGFIAIDTAKLSRCNVGSDLDEDWVAGHPLANVDHHTTNTEFGTINWVVGDAASSCELVYQLIRQAGKPIKKTDASLLYAGILTDTFGFSLDTTKGFCLRAAADLVDLGAEVGDLGERLYRTHQISEFRLLRTIYANTHLTAENRIAYSTADHDEITSVGCTAADIDEQVAVPRSLAGVRMALLFTEGVKGKTRLNFRGERGISVLDLARKFNGGGHKAAAGAILDCDIKEALAEVLPAAVEELDRQRARDA
jgi:phosphoesterase RecJ-like protein